MSDNVYSVTEIVGSSTESVEDAIEQAIKTAAKSLKNLNWFEVVETRGHIENQEVAHYQVSLKVGFRFEG